MLFLIGMATFFAGIYFCRKAILNYHLFKNGINSTATVVEIEKMVHYDDDRESFTYWIHVKLPDYYGRSLGKKYQRPVDPKRFTIGEILTIIQRKDYPTEFVIKKELGYLDIPKVALIVGISFLLVSYSSCYLVK